MRESIGNVLIGTSLVVGLSMFSYAVGGLKNYEKGKELGMQLGYVKALRDVLDMKKDDTTIEGE